MHRKRVTCDLHDSYFRSMTIKHAFQWPRKCIFQWPVMGRDWVDVELLYNSAHWKFKQFGDQKSWRNDAVEKTAPSRELDLRASGWATLENGKETLMSIRVGDQYVAVLFGLQIPLTLNPFKEVSGIFF